jgi:hypothetical protein
MASPKRYNVLIALATSRPVLGALLAASCAVVLAACGSARSTLLDPTTDVPELQKPALRRKARVAKRDQPPPEPRRDRRQRPRPNHPPSHRFRPLDRNHHPADRDQHQPIHI